MSLREASNILSLSLEYGFLGTLYSIFWRRDLSTKNDQS